MPLGQSRETAARIQWDDQRQDWAQGLVLRKPSWDELFYYSIISHLLTSKPTEPNLNGFLH